MSRPKPVTAVVLLSIVQGALTLLVGAGIVALSADRSLESTLELDRSASSAAGALLVVFGLVECMLAVGLARGSDAMRTVFGIINTIHVATQVFVLVALRDLRFATAWSLVLPLGLLWLLYGSAAAREYFER